MSRGRNLPEATAFPAQAFIAAALKKTGPTTVSSLQSELKKRGLQYSDATVRKYLHRMRSDGKVTQKRKPDGQCNPRDGEFTTHRLTRDGTRFLKTWQKLVSDSQP